MQNQNLGKVFIASDHAGVEFKAKLKTLLPLNWVDLGTDSSTPVDYPDIATTLAHEIKKSPVHSEFLFVEVESESPFRQIVFPLFARRLCTIQFRPDFRESTMTQTSFV